MWRIARFVGIATAGILMLAPATAREASLSPEARGPSPLLGVVWKDVGRGSWQLVSVDPRSLETLPRRTLPLYAPGAWAFSPGRARLAITGSCQIGNGLSGGITFVDVKRLRKNGCLWLGGAGPIVWPSPSRLVAVASGDVVSIDPVHGRVLGRTALPQGQVVAKAVAGDGLVLLLAAGGVGRLVVVDAGGSVRSVPLDLPAGIQPRAATFVQPGLAVDPGGRRVFVVAGLGVAAEVSLDSLAVQYHELRENVSLLGRIAAWLQPAAQAKELLGESRTAVWLQNGMLAVAGTRMSDGRAEPTGLTLIDTRSWLVKTIDPNVNGIRIAQGRIVATGPRVGVAVFDLEGRLLYRRLGGRDIRVDVVYRGRIYAAGRVLDLATGKQVARRAGSPPQLLLASSG